MTKMRSSAVNPCSLPILGACAIEPSHTPLVVILRAALWPEESRLAALLFQVVAQALSLCCVNAERS
jgi:hypothetical protein